MTRADDAIGCILVTGSEKALRPAPTSRKMQPKTFIDMFSAISRPLAATVSPPAEATIAGRQRLCARRRLRACDDV